MIYVCADDYGVCDVLSGNIEKCVNAGAINKVSAFANFGKLNISESIEQSDAKICLHLNLVEGKAMAKKESVNLIADENGMFRCTFGGLLLLSLARKKEFEHQIYNEIKAQIKFWTNHLPPGAPLLIDSHQHTHMIPSVFKMLMRVIDDEKLKVNYLRIPSEPVLPYVCVPSLYCSYSFVNLIKQWLLKALWQINKPVYRKNPIPTACFMGILFSGRMDEKRISKVLPHYIKKARKNKSDIEILFHPGYMNKSDVPTDVCNLKFGDFYFSDNRRNEFDAVMNLKY